MKNIFMLCACFALLAACSDRSTLSAYHDSAVYYNGTVVTVDDLQSVATAFAVGDGQIVAVGSDSLVLSMAAPNTRLVDLEGHIVLPGFIDSHSHIAQVGKYPQFSPAAGVVSIDSLVDFGRRAFGSWLQHAVDQGRYAEGDWFVGTGYDNTSFPDAVKPVADDLDRISTEVPIVIIHSSNHTAVVNHKALEMMGFTKDSPLTNQFGSLVGKDLGGNPNGQLAEDAFFRLYYSPNVMLDSEVTDIDSGADNLEKAMQLYACYGITTAQDGAGSDIDSSVVELLSRGKELLIDIVSFGQPAAMSGKSRDAQFENGLKHQGIKIILDGSPQAKTAWLREPYYVVPDGYATDYRGFPSLSDDSLYVQLVDALQNGWQVYAHTNGSAAIDQFITQYTRAEHDTGIEGDMRPVLIHAQTITDDQLDSAERAGIDVSFFHDHTYYWGDYHLSSVLGPERGARISPLSEALKRDINVTIHQDSPVVPPDMLFSIHNAVNRTTRNGQPIGSQYAVSPAEAIKMVTINAARQYDEQDTRGSIEKGKLADFVILDRNPLTVRTDSIKYIEVLETVKRGRTIYRR